MSANGELIPFQQQPEAAERWPTGLTLQALKELAMRRPLTLKETVALSARIDTTSDDPQARARGRAAILEMEKQNQNDELQSERLVYSPGAREIRQQVNDVLIILPDNGRELIELEDDTAGQSEDRG